MSAKPRPRRYRTMMLVLAGCLYASLAVAGALIDSPVCTVVGLLVFLTVLLWPALAQRRRGAWVLWTVFVVILSAATAADVARSALDALAIPINAAIGWIFARTLRSGHEPLIAQMVRQIEGPLRLQEPGVAGYARALTTVWAVVLLGQAAALLLIWLLLHGVASVNPASSTALWLHRYLSYGSFVVMGLVFVLEYPWRRHRLAHLEHMPFLQVSRQVAANWQELMRGVLR